MTVAPSEAPKATLGNNPPAVLSCPKPKGLRPSTLRLRRDFLAAARAAKQGTPGFMVQARNRRDDDPAIRLGITCSKKIGNAVARNRAKRRLRALAAELLPDLGKPGFDYVLVGRPQATISRAFDALREDLSSALDKLHSRK